MERNARSGCLLLADLGTKDSLNEKVTPCHPSTGSAAWDISCRVHCGWFWCQVEAQHHLRAWKVALGNRYITETETPTCQRRVFIVLSNFFAPFAHSSERQKGKKHVRFLRSPVSFFPMRRREEPLSTLARAACQPAVNGSACGH